MERTIIIVLCIAQANCMSFYDVFAPVEDSVGRLVTDVVSDLRGTIDCTLLAVKRVFTLDGIFGETSEYEKRCKGQNADNNVIQNYDSTLHVNTPAPDTFVEKAAKDIVEKEIIQNVVKTASDAKTSIQEILNQSNAHSKIEKVQNTLKNESDRLNQLRALLRHELEKLPDKVRKKFSLNPKNPTKLEDIFDEIRLLYEVEIQDKSSAEANKVRHIFDKVLVILRCTSLDRALSDEEQVKLILKLLGESSNVVEKQVTVWTDEENKDIKNIMIITNATKALSNTKGDEDKTKEIRLLTEKIDEMETQQARMVDVSHSLKDLTKNIRNKVSSIGSSKPSNELHNTVNLLPKDHDDDVSVISEKEDNSNCSSTESPTFTEIISISTESPSSITYNNRTTKTSTTTETNYDSTESSVFQKSSKETDNLTTESDTTKTVGSSELSPRNNPPALTTTELSTSSDIRSVFIESTGKLNSDSIESHSRINENNITASAQHTSPITITESIYQEKPSAAQLPLTITSTIEFKPVLQSISQTNFNTTGTLVKTSNTIVTLSTIQSSQTSSNAVQNIQSNSQMVNTTAQLPASNANASSLDLSKKILNEVSLIGSLKPSNKSNASVSPIRKDHDDVSVILVKEERSHHLSTESPTTTEIISVPTESPSIIRNDRTTETSTTTESNSVSTASSASRELSKEKDNLKQFTDSTLRNGPPALTTTESSLVDIRPVSIESTTERNNVFTELHTKIKANTFASPITTTESTYQEKLTTAQLSPTIIQRTTELQPVLQSISETNNNNSTNTLVKSSRKIVTLSNVQSSQTSSNNVQTVKMITTAAQLPASKAQQLEANPQDNSKTLNTSQANSEENSARTQPTQITKQRDTETDLPKDFKELAQKLFKNNNPPEYKDYDYSYQDTDTGTKELSVLKSLFAPQDPASQQKAVDSAKNVIEESKRATAILNKLFSNPDRSSAPSVFDDYDYQ